MNELHKDSAKLKYVLPGGEIVPSVTTVLEIKDKPGLKWWANAQGLKGIRLSRAGEGPKDIGSIAHYLVDCTSKGRKPIIGEGFLGSDIEKAQEIHDAFWKIVDEKGLEIDQTEVRLIDPVNKFGGTMDLLGKIKGRPVLWDLKSSKNIYVDYYIQVGAYQCLCECNALGTPDPCIILITKDGRVDARDISDAQISYARAAWWGLLAAYKPIKELEHLI